jgi:hypothetical protein
MSPRLSGFDSAMLATACSGQGAARVYRQRHEIHNFPRHHNL